MHFLILLVVQAAMPGAIAEEERKSSALEMLQASDIRIPVEVDLGSTFEEINALSKKFKELESKIVHMEEASETKISGLKSEMAQMEEALEASETKITGLKWKNRGLKSEIAQMKEASESKISGLESKIAHVEKSQFRCVNGWTALDGTHTETFYKAFSSKPAFIHSVYRYEGDGKWWVTWSVNKERVTLKSYTPHKQIKGSKYMHISWLACGN